MVIFWGGEEVGDDKRWLGGEEMIEKEKRYSGGEKMVGGESTVDCMVGKEKGVVGEMKRWLKRERRVEEEKRRWVRIRVFWEKKVASKNERRGRGRDSWGEEEIALKKNKLLLKETDSLEGKEIYRGGE
jgi:hypothetical protein